MRESWRTITVTTALSWLMKLILIGSFPYSVYKGDYLYSIAAVIAIAVSLAPSIIQRNYRVTLPFELDFLITLSIFAHIFFGEQMHFYERFWLWDKILHVYGSAVLSLLAFITVYTFHRTGKLKLTLPFIGLFTVVFTLAAGGIWEIAEFTVDKLLDLDTQRGLDNTMWDIINDLIGGMLAAFLGILYVRYSHPDERRRLAKPLGEVLNLNTRVENARQRLAKRNKQRRRRTL
ncbi:MAG: hypothetical protein ACE5GF_04155 [Thermodesulfobacteriota bacterium]